jgi:hypothetical protein
MSAIGEFYILLTVHRDAILGNDQLDALFLNVFILRLYMFRGPNCHSDSHSLECVIPDDVLIQFGSPDAEHLPLETWRGINKYIKKECIKLVITQKSATVLRVGC